jgi:hypothetical protein
MQKVGTETKLFILFLLKMAQNQGYSYLQQLQKAIYPDYRRGKLPANTNLLKQQPKRITFNHKKPNPITLYLSRKNTVTTTNSLMIAAINTALLFTDFT